MEFAVGLMVVAIAVMISGSQGKWSGPDGGKYLWTTAVLLAAAIGAEALGVVIESSDAFRALAFLSRLALGGAVLVFVNGALADARGGRAPTTNQGF